MSKRDEQIARMRGLMTYGTTNTTKKTPVTESIEGPDGNIYAVIREGTKFYIKSTPKGSELVAESFDYIGGFMNKKNNEFSSYNQASKNLELKVRSLNEAYGVNKTVELHNPDKKETLMVEMTDAMKASLARYRQIVNEASAISMSNTGVPEAPKTTGFSPKLGGPFTDTAEATLDTDLKKTANDPEKQGEPFGNNKKAEAYKDAQYVPDGSVANKKPSGGKVVRVNESDCDCYEETFEECDEWGSCGLPSAAGVGEVGDTAPFTKRLKESGYFHNDSVADEDQLEDTPEVIDIDIKEAAEAFAGMPSLGEGEDEEDIDLDDIDMDLDSEEDDEEDIDLDDIDTEESLDDEGELDDEESEVESLRAEVEELRNLVSQLMGDEEEEEENEYELELGDDEDELELGDDEDEFDMEDEDMDDEFDDEDMDDEEMFPESRQYVRNLVESILNEDRGMRMDALKDPRSRYYIGEMIANLAQQYGANERDMRLIGYIKGRLVTILESEYKLKENQKNGNNNEEEWYELLASMENAISQLAELVGKLPFLENVDDSIRRTIDGRVNKFYTIHEKFQDFYDENIDTSNVEVEPEMDDEEMPETPEADIDNVGFEDDVQMTDDEQNDAAWEGAEDFDEDDFDYMSLDLSSVTPRRINEAGTRLNVFGKHPGYRKKVMSLPRTGADREGIYRDWNDDSVYSEQPYGEHIGSSAPFDNVVKASVDSIVESLKKKL